MTGVMAMAEEKTHPEILTLEEVAEYLRVHTSTIYRLIKKEELPHFRVGRDHRFSLKSIDEWRINGGTGVRPKPDQV